METVETVVVGAGMTGLATAAALGDREYVILEGDSQIGGYCKTIKIEGFVWDYSGHFFHFKHPEVEAWLRARMGDQEIRRVEKRSFIRYADKLIDFPFQKNIHQLPQDDFIDCLFDLYFASLEGASAAAPRHFKDMLIQRFGRSIAEKFLIPYNEKLYATDLSLLDQNAMGRFFPHADLTDIIRNMRQADNSSYNSSFTYPEGGAFEYVLAMASAVRQDAIALNEPLIGLDLENRVARTPKREIRYRHLVSSTPLPKLLELASIAYDKQLFAWNKVLVFNLGFDAKGPPEAHWIYYPERELCFYRVGFYDNIFDSSRMSLYVEMGFDRFAEPDPEQELERVLRDLERAGVITDQKLIASHHVIMDPAYVHITEASNAAKARFNEQLAKHGVHSIGRYGGWTYCSIEDNIVEARELVTRLSQGRCP